VIEGIKLGKILGNKLKIIPEINTTTYTRKDSGKMDKRLLAELGFGNESIFKKVYLSEYPNSILHISIDISYSMSSNEKFYSVLKIVTAVCMAANVTKNKLNVVVNVRGTINIDSGKEMPFVAIVYDSRVDDINKIIRLFPMLTTCGGTPEGICFSAISDLILESSKNLNSYFLNLSDGMPMYGNYRGPFAIKHTKSEVNKMRKKGIKILSYFIKTRSKYINFIKGDFEEMYGKDAADVDSENLIEIAKTLNKLFLSKN